MIKYLIPLLLLSISLYSKDEKLELGIGIGTIIFPDYIGSKSNRDYNLAYPYIDYRGDYFKIDKNGIKSDIFNIKDLKLNISMNGSLPANSEDNKVREGMPDLDFTFEIGPNLIYFIYANQRDKLYFEFPVRAVFSTDFESVESEGFLTTPQLTYKINYKKLYIALISGVVLANNQYNNYFYEVKYEYKTANRAKYKASKGYGGFRNKIEVGYKKDNLWAGAALSHYNIRGAVFENSPLVEISSAIYFGASIAYIFYNSSK